MGLHYGKALLFPFGTQAVNKEGNIRTVSQCKCLETNQETAKNEFLKWHFDRLKVVGTILTMQILIAALLLFISCDEDWLL